MKDLELMPAKEAREFVEAGKAQKDQDSLAKAVKVINTAIAQGELKAFLNGSITAWAKKQLEEKGYTVVSGGTHNESYTNISW